MKIPFVEWYGPSLNKTYLILYPWMLCDKFKWNCPSGVGEEIFYLFELEVSIMIYGELLVSDKLYIGCVKKFAIVIVQTLLNNFLIYYSSLNRDFVWFRIVYFFMHIYGFKKWALIILCVYHLKINICLPIWRYTVQCTEFESNRFFTGLVRLLAVPYDLRFIWFVYF